MVCAMAMGRAIITADTPGCRETVIPEHNGMLVPAQCIDSLERAMQRFIDEPALAQRMGQCSRAIAEDRYDVRKVIKAIADKDSSFEIKERFGKSLCTMLARLNGHSVGFIANNPMFKGGALDADACQKVISFMVLCDSYNIPLVYLVDVPGFLIGVGIALLIALAIARLFSLLISGIATLNEALVVAQLIGLFVAALANRFNLLHGGVKNRRNLGRLGGLWRIKGGRLPPRQQ